MKVTREMRFNQSTLNKFRFDSFINAFVNILTYE